MNSNTQKIKIMTALIFATTIFLLSSTGWAAMYYVSATNGNDTNSGTSRSDAFKTIQKAANIMSAGDESIVLQGTYNERITITKSGTSGNKIIFKAEGLVSCNGFIIRADNIRVEGFTITNNAAISGWSYTSRVSGSGIQIEGSNCEIENNNITSASCLGISTFINSRSDTSKGNNIIRGNTITNAGLSGIYIVGNGNLIENNDISHSTKNGMGDADGIRVFGINHIFRNNYIHDIYLNEGNDGAHIDCFQSYGPLSNILIDGNTCINTDQGMQGTMIEQLFKPVSDLTFRNNTFVTQGGSIVITNKGNQGPMPRMEVTNNTITNTGWYAVTLVGTPDSILQNNIFADTGGHNRPYLLSSSETTGLVVGNNDHWMSDGKAPAGSPYPNDLWQVNPLFVNFAARDFTLQPESPLCGAGQGGKDIGANPCSEVGAPPNAPTGLKIL